MTVTGITRSGWAYWRALITQPNNRLAWLPTTCMMNSKASKSPSMAAYSGSACPCSERKSFPPKRLVCSFFTEFFTERRDRSRMPSWGGRKGGKIKHSKSLRAPNVTEPSDYR